MELLIQLICTISSPSLIKPESSCTLKITAINSALLFSEMPVRTSRGKVQRHFKQ